ncbi:MAG: hypothetical protein HY540_02995, partial [Deltaproteobacteria bacterium]|nr:hypothetical protein [Deltaproteobacteria bacterium]
HNLGPQREFKIASKEGKSAGEIFGEAAGFLEEFKAQTSAMSLQEYLLQKGVYTKDRVKANYTAGVMWMLGHLKKHLYAKDDFTKARSSYAKLAGIQFGWLVKQGAVSFNDADKVWQINYAKLPAAIESLMTTVGSIYASGNRDALEALTKQYLTGPMLAKYHLDVLEERVGSDPNVALHYEVLP